MNRDDAEEFTQGLGQSLAGNWRMVFWAQRMGVPKALDLTTREWVQERLGGYVDLSVADRQKAVAELEDEGLSAPKTADVLGVDNETVYRDRRALASANAEGPETDSSANAELALKDAESPTLVFEDEIARESTRWASATGEVEWFTPERYLNAAREVMGAIDLDPASSERAQQRVRAEHCYTRETDGLKQPWFGRIFLNPPYESRQVQAFVRRLLTTFTEHEVTEAILLVNSSPDTQWFQDAERACSALCHTRGRIAFHKGEKDGSITEKTTAGPVGQTFFYFGPRIERFCEVFRLTATNNHVPAIAGVFREVVSAPDTLASSLPV